MTSRRTLVESEALKTLKRAGVHGPPVDPIAVAAVFDVRVTKVEPPRPDISGFLLREDPETAKPAIGVNRNHSVTRRRFTIAHELGHFLLEHPGDYQIDSSIVSFRDESSSAGDRKLEVEANRFAAALLMPKEWLTADFSQNPFDLEEDSQLRRLAKRYGVSPQAMTFRLVNLGLVE